MKTASVFASPGDFDPCSCHWIQRPEFVNEPLFSTTVAAGNTKTSVLMAAESALCPSPPVGLLFQNSAVSFTKKSTETSQSSFERPANICPALGPAPIGFWPRQTAP